MPMLSFISLWQPAKQSNLLSYKARFFSASPLFQNPIKNHEPAAWQPFCKLFRKREL
jgi:hypothetical protein